MLAVVPSTMARPVMSMAWLTVDEPAPTKATAAPPVRWMAVAAKRPTPRATDIPPDGTLLLYGACEPVNARRHRSANTSTQHFKNVALQQVKHKIGPFRLQRAVPSFSQGPPWGREKVFGPRLQSSPGVAAAVMCAVQ